MNRIELKSSGRRAKKPDDWLLVLWVLGFNQDYLKGAPDGSRRAESLALRAVAAGLGINYTGFAIHHGYGAGGAKLNTISTARTDIEIDFGVRHF